MHALTSKMVSAARLRVALAGLLTFALFSWQNTQRSSAASGARAGAADDVRHECPQRCGAAPIRVPAVCSHRGAGSAYFEEGSLEGVRALLRDGVACFDMDFFVSADGLLVVGHPSHLQQRLGLTDVARVHELSHRQLVAAARRRDAPSPPLFGELLEVVAARAGAWLTAEPKGARAARAATLRSAALVAHRAGLGDRLALVMPADARLARQLDGLAGPRVALAMPIKSSFARAPGGAAARAARLHLHAHRAGGVGGGRLFELWMPSHDVLCQARAAAQRAAGAAVSDERLRSAVSWVIDTPESLGHALVHGVAAVVSNKPLQMAAALEEAAAARGCKLRVRARAQGQGQGLGQGGISTSGGLWPGGTLLPPPPWRAAAHSA